MKKRKGFYLILAMLLAFSIVFGSMNSASRVEAEESEFKIENGVLVSYQGNGGDVVIPDSVTSIGDSAFDYCYNLTSVTIPDSVTSIGDSAFAYCHNLVSVKIPDSVTSIGDWAFYECYELKKANIPSSVTKIGTGIFDLCRSLNTINIPDSITSIGDYAFSGCALKTVYIPNSVTSIGAYAFDGRSLVSIVIPDSVMSIGEYAFGFYCPENLTVICVSNSVAHQYAIETGILYTAYDRDQFYPNIIAKQPENITAVDKSGNVHFSVIAFGDGLSYQWYWRKNSTATWGVSGSTGAKTDTLSIDAIMARNGYQYRCVITDKEGNKITSETASLTVEKGVKLSEEYFHDEILRIFLAPYDLNEDKYLGESEIREITSLEIYWINDIEGIKYLTSLESFGFGTSYEGDASCTELDFSGMKSLKKVDYCHSCVKKIDISGCTSLEYLNCSGNKELSELNISGCTSLNTLICDGSALTTIDTSSCPNLKVIKTCNSCMPSVDSVNEEVLKKLGNNKNAEIQKVVEVEPSCTEDGYKGNKVCSICGEVLQYGEKIPATGHKWKQNSDEKKTNYVSLVCETCGKKAYSDVVINKENFPDDAFRAYISEKIDTDKDGILSFRELSRDQYFRLLTNRNINSLKGIEFFNVRWLDCEYRLLSDIDVENVDWTIWASMYVQGSNEDDVTTMDISGIDGWDTRIVDKRLYCAVMVYSLGQREGGYVNFSDPIITFKHQYPFLPTEQVYARGTYRYSETKNIELMILLEEMEHQWDDGVITKVPEGDHWGEILYTCKECGKTEKRVMTRTSNEFAITKQPENQVAKAGTVKFAVKATGFGLSYQWQWRKNSSSEWGNCGFAGCKTDTMSVDVISARNGYQYRCKVTAKDKNVIFSEPATLYYSEGAKIAVQPADQTAMNGTAVFKVGATGDGLTYQWYWRRNTLNEWGVCGFTGAKTATMQVPVISSRNGFQYRCEVKDKYGNVVYSNPATLTVAATNKAVITKQPVNQTAKTGNAVFTVGATGDGLTYQWYWRKNAASEWGIAGFTGAKTASMQVPVISSRNGFQYRCEVKDKYGNVVYSEPATLYYGSKATITKQPVNINIAAGKTATFSLKATGDGLTYQWYWRKNSSSEWGICGFTGARTASMQVPAITARNGYQYQCVIKDKYGNTVTSTAVTFTVTQ